MSYSQNSEEKIIADFFGSYVGVFLDIGSNDGKTLSNTLALAEKMWGGVCIEPSPLAFACLSKLYLDRDDVYCYKLAVADFIGKAKFYDSGVHVPHLNRGDTGLLSSLHEEETFKWKPTTEFTEIKVDVVDFKSLLKLSPYKTFDFISIDAEGNDLCILRQMDLRKLECQCCCIEYNSIPENFTAITDIVFRQGYELLHRNAENLIFKVI